MLVSGRVYFSIPTGARLLSRSTLTVICVFQPYFVVVRLPNFRRSQESSLLNPLLKLRYWNSGHRMGVSEHEQMGGNATMRPQPFWASWNPHFSAHLVCCSRNIPFTHTTLQSPRLVILSLGTFRLFAPFKRCKSSSSTPKICTHPENR